MEFFLVILRHASNQCTKRHFRVRPFTKLSDGTTNAILSSWNDRLVTKNNELWKISLHLRDDVGKNFMIEVSSWPTVKHKNLCAFINVVELWKEKPKKQNVEEPQRRQIIWIPFLEVADCLYESLVDYLSEQFRMTSSLHIFSCFLSC